MRNELERVMYAKVEAPSTAPKASAVVNARGPVVFGGLSGFMLDAISGVDIALWDLAGF